MSNLLLWGLIVGAVASVFFIGFFVGRVVELTAQFSASAARLVRQIEQIESSTDTNINRLENQ